MTKSWGYAAQAAGSDLMKSDIERRALGAKDVLLEIRYCGLCHSDLHAVDNDMGMTLYPIVPGHEIVGRIAAVGTEVSKFKVGDVAAIGCYTDSCSHCVYCEQDKQQLCSGFVGAFGGYERDGKQRTYGGFSNNYVANEDYVFRMPANLDPAAAAPLLCAGITTWSPLRLWKVGPGMNVGVVGLGGLGHMAVKLAVALGAQVSVFTTSAGKKQDALDLGARTAIVSTDPAAMEKATGQFDFILDTVAAQHDINGYLGALKPEGVFCVLGIAPGELGFMNLPLVFGQKVIAGSLIGGLRDTQEMLDFCGRNNITATIELLPASRINEAFKRLHKNDVKYRFVLDMAAQGGR
ncbi:MAG: NAD(P)-dependent alcohol dehydrogenase [Steroidobacteraceae bacterium]